MIEISVILFVIIMGILAGVFLWFTLNKFTLLIEAKEMYYRTLADKELAETQIKKIDNTADIINIIRVVIDNNIMEVMKKYFQLKERYNLLTFDEDLILISTESYNALKPKLFINDNTILTSNYLQKFIIQESTIRFLNIINEHNSSFLT